MSLKRKKKGILGIDPGLDGGLVLLSEKREVLETFIMPIIKSTKTTETKPQKDGKTKTKRSTKKILDVAEVNRIFEHLQPITTHAFLESISARPHEGVVSVFKFGQVYGVLQAMLAAHKMPHTLVTPAKWAKVIHSGITGLEPKEKSRVALGRLFPDTDLKSSERSKKPHEGLMDGLLIAEYGRRWLESQQFE